MNAAALWKIGKASLETSEWQGEYRGTLLRLLRVTDEDYWPGRNPMHEKGPTTTRWDGYVASGLERDLSPRWVLVAECYRTRREVLAELMAHVDGVTRSGAGPEGGPC